MTRTRRQLIWFAILGPGLFVATLAFNEIHGRYLVRRELALCRQVGMRIDPEELKQPPIPADQNAAPLYRQAFEEIERISSAMTAAQVDDELLAEELQVGRSKQTDKIVAAAGRYLERYATVIRLALEAQSRPYCRYDESLNSLYSGQLAQARLLACRTTYLYHTKGPEAAWQALAQSLKGEHAFSEGAGITNVLVRIAMVQTALQPLRQMIEEDALPTGVAVEKMIRRLPSRCRLIRQARKGLSGEISGTQEWFDEARQPKYLIFPLFENQYKAAVFRSLRMAHENTDRIFVEVRSLPWPPERWYHVSYAAASAPGTPAAWSWSARWVLSSWGSNMKAALACLDELWAEVDLMRIGLLLEAHRRRYGDYPQTLEALRMPDGRPLPTDPFDGEPYRYRKEEGGYRLWSVGRDCIDNGGIGMEEERQSKDYDIVLWIGPKARAHRLADREENDASLFEDDEEEAPGHDEEPAGGQAEGPTSP